MRKKEEELSLNQEKQVKLSEETENLKNKMSSQNLTIHKLKTKITELNDPLVIAQNLWEENIEVFGYKALKSDEIDQNLMFSLQQSKIPIKMTRISEGKYCYGSLKIELMIENSKLMANFDGQVVSFEEFNRKHLLEELKKLINLSQKEEVSLYSPNEFEENKPKKELQQQTNQRFLSPHTKMSTASNPSKANPAKEKESDSNQKKKKK